MSGKINNSAKNNKGYNNDYDRRFNDDVDGDQMSF